MPEFYAEDGWRFSLASAGGGVAIDAGSHFLRPLRMWCGELREVVAVTGRPQAAMEGESLCRALCRFESGVVASFDALLAVAAGAAVPRFQLTGTTGEIVIDATHVRLFPASGGAGTVAGESAYLESYAGEWHDFEAAVLDGTPLAAPPAAALGEFARARDVPLVGVRSLGARVRLSARTADRSGRPRLRDAGRTDRVQPLPAALARGKRMATSKPPSRTFRPSTRPPIRSTSPRTSASPSPVPRFRRVSSRSPR